MQNLTLIQSSLKAPKDLYNSFGKYNYRSVESILEGLKPILADMDLAVVMEDTVTMVGNRYYVVATATLRSGDNIIARSTGWAREAEEKKGMDSAQVTGSTSSYARKIALAGLFAIDDSKDSDALNNGGDLREAGSSTTRSIDYKIKNLGPKSVESQKIPPSPAMPAGEKVEPRPDLGPKNTTSTTITKAPEAQDKKKKVSKKPAAPAEDTVTMPMFQEAFGADTSEMAGADRYKSREGVAPEVIDFEVEMNKRMDDYEGLAAVGAQSLDAFILYLQGKYNLPGTIDDLKVLNIKGKKTDDLWQQYIDSRLNDRTKKLL